MDEEKLLKQIVRRLDIIIALQTEGLAKDEVVIPAQKIKRLASVGLSPSEIATFIGKPTNYVTATLARKKKQRSGKGRSK